MFKTTDIYLFTIALFLATNNLYAQDHILGNGQLENAFSSWGTPSLQGDWKIISTGNKTVLELGENFKAKGGPDVKIFFSPLKASQVTGKNASDGSAYVTQISVFEGKNIIEIPANISPDDFQSLVFHCEAYSKLWGVSALR